MDPSTWIERLNRDPKDPSVFTEISHQWREPLVKCFTSRYVYAKMDPQLAEEWFNEALKSLWASKEAITLPEDKPQIDPAEYIHNLIVGTMKHRAIDCNKKRTTKKAKEIEATSLGEQDSCQPCPSRVTPFEGSQVEPDLPKELMRKIEKELTPDKLEMLELLLIYRNCAKVARMLGKREDSTRRFKGSLPDKLAKLAPNPAEARRRLKKLLTFVPERRDTVSEGDSP